MQAESEQRQQWKPSKQSTALYEKKMRHKLSIIFDQLIGNKEDKLTTNNLVPQNIPYELQKIFEPIFREMVEYGETLM